MSFSRIWRGCALAALVTLAACGPSITPQPQPTPVVFTIQHTPALNVLREEMNACMSGLAGAGLVVDEQSAPNLALGESDVVLRWDVQGAPPNFTAVIGQEELVVVAHLENPRDSITLADLQAIYTGEIREWPEAGAMVAPYAYPAGDDVQFVFESVILDGASIPDRVTYTAPDPAAVIDAISVDPIAVGFVPRRWLSEGVKELAIEGIEPERLVRPLVAFAEKEPAGPARGWLLCLQERLQP